MSAHRVDPKLTIRARDLRANATDAERVIWDRLLRHRPKFTRQLPIDAYIADLESPQWVESRIHDGQR